MFIANIIIVTVIVLYHCSHVPSSFPVPGPCGYRVLLLFRPESGKLPPKMVVDRMPVLSMAEPVAGFKTGAYST